MSTMEPFIPHPSGDDEGGVPAADPGHAGPPSAPGFGVQGEEPDGIEDREPGQAVEDRLAARTTGENPFRTPDPEQLRQGS
jgi:hypothetical protein